MPFKKNKNNPDQKFEDCFEKISTQTEVALAVSGGPDSMALLLLVDRWRRKRLERGQIAPDLTIFTVDHGLRETAADDCRFVLDKARSLGYEAERLSWTGPKPVSRVQETARDYRYQLLAAACHLRGIKVLMTAHHLDDQVETFLMRLARGSGVDGLSAMALESRRYGLRLLRPFLEFRKEELQTELEASGWDHVTDPGNTDRRFERVRLREAAGALEALGLSAGMIGLGVRRLRRARAALDEMGNDFVARNVLISSYGTARMDQLAFHDAPDEIALRALSRILKLCGGRQDVANMARLESLTEKLKSDFVTNSTLAGCRIISRGDFWLIVREAGRITELEKPLIPGDCIFWDNRYVICADKGFRDGVVAGPLHRERDLEMLADHKSLAAIPHEALDSLLSLRHRGRLVGVPALDYWNPAEMAGLIEARLITGEDSL